jgi:hypothetical protein
MVPGERSVPSRSIRLSSKLYLFAAANRENTEIPWQLQSAGAATAANSAQGPFCCSQFRSERWVPSR